jgi:hypothetical protein
VANAAERLRHSRQVLREANIAEPSPDDGPALGSSAKAAVEAVADPTSGLSSFQLKPPNLSGDALLAHMVQFRKRRTSENETAKPSDYLNLELDQHQEGLLNPTWRDEIAGTVMKLASGIGAKHKLAKRKLGMDGGITSRCIVANDPKRVKRLRACYDLAASLAEISRRNASAKKRKRAQKAEKSAEQDAKRHKRAENAAKEKTKLAALGPAALAKLISKGGTVTSTGVTRNDLRAIVARFFDQLVKQQPKADLERIVGELLTTKPDLLQGVPGASGGDGAAGGGGGAAASGGESEDSESEEEEEEEEDDDDHSDSEDEDDAEDEDDVPTDVLAKVGRTFRDTDDGDLFRCVGVSTEVLEIPGEEGVQRKLCFRFVSTEDPCFDGPLGSFVFDEDDGNHFYTPVDEIMHETSTESGRALYEWLM